MCDQINGGGTPRQHHTLNFLRTYAGRMPAPRSHTDAFTRGDSKCGQTACVQRSVVMTGGNDLDDFSGQRYHGLFAQPVNFQTTHLALPLPIDQPEDLRLAVDSWVKNMFLLKSCVRIAEGRNPIRQFLSSPAKYGGGTTA